MGSILQAKCSCGFNSEGLFVGGGFRNFLKVCSAPALCKRCSAIVVLNYLKKKNKCPSCKSEVIFYNDFSLQRKTKKEYPLFDWNIGEDEGSFILPDTKYYCPKCNKLKMKFIRSGSWD